MEYRPIRVIISGGGTGGHIFPAISIASKFKELNPDSRILFVGAKGKMEMEKVPAAGFDIIGLPISGLVRKLSLKGILHNIQVPFKVLYSKSKAGREKVGKKGVVRDKNVHQEVIELVINYARSIGFRVCNLDFSPIKGPEGNIEYLLHLVNNDIENSELSDNDISESKILEVVNSAHENLD